MTYESAFDEFFNKIVMREAYAGQNDFGEASYSSVEYIKARVVYKSRLVVTGAGDVSSGVQEVVSKATVYCGMDPKWNQRDRITLPDGTTPLILIVETFPDETDDHHQRVVV